LQERERLLQRGGGPPESKSRLYGYKDVAPLPEGYTTDIWDSGQ